MTLRTEELSEDFNLTSYNSVNNFQYYSVALDESFDVKDTVQLAIFVRGINSEFIITEELVELVLLQGRWFSSVHIKNTT